MITNILEQIGAGICFGEVQQLRYELSQVYDRRELLLFNGATWIHQQRQQQDIDTPITYDDYSERYEIPR